MNRSVAIFSKRPSCSRLYLSEEMNHLESQIGTGKSGNIQYENRHSISVWNLQNSKKNQELVYCFVQIGVLR